MNQKMVFSFVLAICAMALAACTTAAPTPATSNNNAAPTTASNTNTNATAPAASTKTEISRDPSLACSGGKTSASATVELTEGPYFTAGSPEQANLYQAGMAGTKLVVTGYVYDTNCQPVANALLDFWQANANGEYDNSGYTLRGHQYTDANGHYELTTVVPGLYPGRTEHIHFKVQAPNGKLITSQLFFPAVQQNDSDGIYDASLLLSIQKSDAEWQGQYNFVVPAK